MLDITRVSGHATLPGFITLPITQAHCVHYPWPTEDLVKGCDHAPTDSALNHMTSAPSARQNPSASQRPRARTSIWGTKTRVKVASPTPNACSCEMSRAPPRCLTHRAAPVNPSALGGGGTDSGGGRGAVYEAVFSIWQRHRTPAASVRIKSTTSHGGFPHSTNPPAFICVNITAPDTLARFTAVLGPPPPPPRLPPPSPPASSLSSRSRKSEPSHTKCIPIHHSLFLMACVTLMSVSANNSRGGTQAECWTRLLQEPLGRHPSTCICTSTV